MMLLRTLVLESSGEDAPVNGALLCGFAVPRITSNFLVYSLDEEAEPGSSRVYIAALRKKLDRYFLGSVDAREDLQVAMQVFKQILVLAASGAKASGVSDTQVPYHFVDLKGCHLPPARPRDHHSVIIKKALVMKVITLGSAVPTSPAIESDTLIVPSIRFSSRMVSPRRAVGAPEAGQPVLPEKPAETESQAAVVVASVDSLPEPAALKERPASSASNEPHSLFEADSTLTNLARVAQGLTQQKLALIKQEETLEQWHAQLQESEVEIEKQRQQLASLTLEQEATLELKAQAFEGREAQLADALAGQQYEQQQLEARANSFEKRIAQVRGQELQVRQKEEKLAAMLGQLPGLRQNLQAMLIELDLAVDGIARTEQPQAHDDLWNIPV